jgi:hypothetical protein
VHSNCRHVTLRTASICFVVLKSYSQCRLRTCCRLPGRADQGVAGAQRAVPPEIRARPLARRDLRHAVQGRHPGNKCRCTRTQQQQCSVAVQQLVSAGVLHCFSCIQRPVHTATSLPLQPWAVAPAAAERIWHSRPTPGPLTYLNIMQHGAACSKQGAVEPVRAWQHSGQAPQRTVQHPAPIAHPAHPAAMICHRR